jgi:transposase InsO family protein
MTNYRRLHASLSDQCVNVSEKVVRRLMKQERLVAATSRRRRYGSYMGEISPAPDNVLNRDSAPVRRTRSGSPISRSSTRSLSVARSPWCIPIAVVTIGGQAG